MTKDFIPTQLQAFCEWAENLKLEFTALASQLGFTAAEITALLTDLNHAIYACRAAMDAGSFGSAWVQYRKTLMHGDAGQPIGSTPGNTMPAAPATTAPPPGVIPRIRAAVKRIKSAPGYTPSMGQTLRIVPGGTTPPDTETVRPDTKATPMPLFKAKLKWKNRGFTAVRTRSRLDGDTAWTDLGLATGSTVVDERPPREAGKPEVRFYEQIYVRNNEPVGQWSDSVRVTLQP